MDNLYKQFGLPDEMFSDRGPQFAAMAFRELLKLLGIKLNLMMAYHPGTDGATEQVNQEIKAYLSIYCSAHPTEWKNLLMRSHNPYPWKSTFYQLFPLNVTILTPSAPTQCPSYISPQTPLHICHPPQLRDKVLVQDLYYSEPHYHSKLSEHWVFHCAVHIISLDFYLY